MKKNFKLSILSSAVSLSLLGVSANVYAQGLDINTSTPYSTVINEDKAKNISTAQANNEKRFSILYDVVRKFADGTYDKNAVLTNLKESDVLQNGDTYSLYNTRGSLVDATVADERIVRLGSGAKVVAGSHSSGLDIADVSNVTIASNQYNFAGNTTQGVVSVGDKDKQSFRTITNVAAARLSDTSVDAVNGSQLHATNQAVDVVDNNVKVLTNKVDTNIANIASNTEKITTNTANITSNTEKINTNTTNIAGNTEKINANTANIAGNTEKINTNTANITSNTEKINTNTANIAVNTEKLLSGISFIDDDGTSITRKLGDSLHLNGDNNISVKAKRINDRETIDSLEISLNKNVNLDSAVLGDIVINKDSGIIAGNKKISNVLDGDVNATSKEAVNGSQLFKLQSQVDNLKLGTPTNVVKYDGDTQDSVTLAGANGTKLTNLQNGAVNADSKDAINGSQLYATNLKINENTVKINSGFNISADNGKGNVQLGSNLNVSGGKNITTSFDNGSLVTSLKDDIVLDSVRTGKSTINDSGVSVGDVKLSDTGLNAAGTKVINIADGEISATSKEAVNGSQIHNLMSNLNIGGTDLSPVYNKIDSNRKLSSQGIASVAAMDIEYPEQKPGQWATGVGIGHYDGQQAMAIGTTFLTENGKYKLNAAYGQGLSKGSKPTAKVSLGWVW